MTRASQRNYRIAKRPWGGYLVLEKQPTYWIKKLFVKKGEALSLQAHKRRYEIWVVLKGKIYVQKGNSRFILSEGEFLKINKKEKHRISGLKESWILEAAFGQMRENDIIRFKDDYGRIK